MKLTTKALKAIEKDSSIANLIAAEFKCSEQTVKRWVEANDKDSDLTKVSALEIIKKKTGMTEEEILTQEPAQA